MARLVVSTVGTSLLTNRAPPDVLAVLRHTANQRELEPADRNRLEAHRRTREQELARADVAEATRLSAELNGILALYGRDPARARASGDRHLLVITDTGQGRMTGELVRGWLDRLGLACEILDPPGGLRTDRLAHFRAALADLTRRLDERRLGLGPSDRLVFNLTGGFKSINGYLQALAMLWSAESVYLFESGEELLRIPSLPIRFDAVQALGPHLGAIRRLLAKGRLPAAEVAEVPSALLFEDEGQVTLSEWGDLLWETTRDGFYREKLLEPPIERLGFSDRFRSEAERLAPDDLAKLNRQLDALARWVATDGRDNPGSLEVKKLRGSPAPPATHEADAWTGTGKRLFGHFADGRFLVDRLGDHL